MTKDIPRIMIAGTGSGCGKTTVTTALLAAQTNMRGSRITAFKCGPDYIDPMFHRRIVGAKTANLDISMCGEETVKALLAENAEDVDLSVMEGVMGFYDGAGIGTAYASSCHLSRLTDTPVILVVSCQGAALSVAAVVKGFMTFRPNNIKGVILNHLSPGLFPAYRQAVEENTGMEVLGFLPKCKEAAIESRHLGLVTAAEIEGLHEKINLLAREANHNIDLDRLWRIGQDAPPLVYEDISVDAIGGIRVGVAYDKAFCFYYEDNFRLLRKLGAEIVFFSPLYDERLPEGLDGLLLGGGYPELYAERLSGNAAMREDIARVIRSGMPCLAECGGFLYLHDSLCGHPMCAVIKGSADMRDRLGPFGYVKLTANKRTVLCDEGDVITGHEFHYSISDNLGDAFLAEKSNGTTWPCMHAKENLLAGYPHLHLWGNIGFAERFVKSCLGYAQSNAARAAF